MDAFIHIESLQEDTTKTKVEQLKMAIKKNQTYRKLLVEHMKTITDVKRTNSYTEKPNIEKGETIPTALKTESSIDVSSYVRCILQFEHFEDEEDLYDYIKDILPSRNEVSNYEQLLNAILIKLLIEKNEWLDTYLQMKKQEAEESELLLYHQMIVEIQNIIDTILKIRDQKQEVIPDTISNYLIFLTKGTKICLEEDIEKMQSAEYGPRLQKLLSSIEDNSFWYKNYRRFNSNNRKLAPVIEVKGFRIRILISRIDVHTYVVIGAFIKKTNWGKDILQTIISKLEYYEDQKKNIIELYQKDRQNYLKQNEDIFKQLNNHIKVYRKGGK